MSSKNNKGMSLMEVTGALILISVVLMPVLGILVNSVVLNQELHNRQSAGKIGENIIAITEKLDYEQLWDVVEDDTYIKLYSSEFDSENPNEACYMFRYPYEEQICVEMFSTMWNNEQYEDGKITAYIFNDYNDIKTNYTTQNDVYKIDDVFYNAILKMEKEETDTLDAISSTTEILGVIVRVEYTNEDNDVIEMTGMIVNE